MSHLKFASKRLCGVSEAGERKMAEGPANRSRGRQSAAAELHVPEPPFRPGDRSIFASRHSPRRGQPRPDEACPTVETHALCHGLIRVLDEDHRAVGAWDPSSIAETLRGCCGPWR
jgi:2-oxoisovalerate dehydrogenase E1 component alpha subunit